MRKILFSFLSVQGDPSRNEEMAGKRVGERRTGRINSEKEQGERTERKKYNGLQKAEFRVSGTEKGKHKIIGNKR
jgi:hypothetical protein